MKSAYRWGGFAILQVGLAACLTAGVWAGDKSSYRSESAAPRTIQPMLEEGDFATADQDVAPPVPKETVKVAPQKLVSPSPAPRVGAPIGAACNSGCGQCDSSDSCASCRRSWCDDACDDGCEPKWTVSGGAMVLHRSGTRDFAVSDIMRTSDVGELDWAAGPRIDLVRHMGCWDVEFLYWHVDGWDDQEVRPVGLLTSEMTGYASRLHNVEFNLKRKFDVITFLVGTRYIELQEKLHDEVRLLGVPALSEEWRTGNYMLGAQVGAEAAIWSRDRISLTGFGKFGIFANHVRDWHDVGIGPIVISNDNSSNETGFVTELGLTANVQLTKRMTAYAGYEVMWIDGVALAPDRLQDLARTNTPLYHGTSFGLEFCW